MRPWRSIEPITLRASMFLDARMHSIYSLYHTVRHYCVRYHVEIRGLVLNWLVFHTKGAASRSVIVRGSMVDARLLTMVAC